MRIYLTAIGDFGHAVAARLASRHTIVQANAHEVFDPSRWAAADLHIVATWRETPSLFEVADRQAHLLQRPWLPLTLDSNSLRVGPLVSGRPGGPCYQCFLGRQFQHGRLRESDRKLFDLYDKDPSCGVRGFLSAHIQLAVVAAEISLAALRDGTSVEFGQMHRFGLLTPSASVDHVLPVHGCRRCWRPEPDGGWENLARDLGGMLSDTAPGNAAPTPDLQPVIR